MGAAIAIAALAASVGFAVYAHRNTQGPSTPPPATGGQGQSDGPPPAPNRTLGQGQSTKQDAPPDAKGGGGGGATQLVTKAGEEVGKVIGNSAQTREGKDIAPGVGGASALAAYLALVGGTAATLSLAAFGGALVIAFDVTLAVVTVVDQVVKAVKTNEWKDFCRAVRALTKTGDFGGGYAYYRSKVKDYDEPEKVWPDRNEDWYGFEDPLALGRPWPGFPGPPVCKPAVALSYPDKNLNGPNATWTFQGQQIDPIAMLAAAQADVDSARAAALASGAPGYELDGKGGVRLTTHGDRDVRKVEPYATALSRDKELRYAINMPWIESPPYVKDQRTEYEKAIDKINLAKKAQAAQAAENQRLSKIGAKTGQTAAEVKADQSHSGGGPATATGTGANNTANTGSTQAGAQTNGTVAAHTGGQTSKGRANGADY